MSFRKEVKLKINKDKKSHFIKDLINKDFKEIYPKRIVESIYFDNTRNFSYLDSEEGTVPRKKIRLRRYIENKKNTDYKLEIKISSFEGRYKKVTSIDKNAIKKYFEIGIIDEMYGLCKPKLIINYDRLYFAKNDYRVTIDTNIKCKKYKDKYFSKINLDAFEVKTKFSSDDDNLNYHFFQNKTRFSKYAESFKILF